VATYERLTGDLRQWLAVHNPGLMLAVTDCVEEWWVEEIEPLLGETDDDS
jgi:hypothetical protein